MECLFIAFHLAVFIKFTIQINFNNSEHILNESTVEWMNVSPNGEPSWGCGSKMKINYVCIAPLHAHIFAKFTLRSFHFYRRKAKPDTEDAKRKRSPFQVTENILEPEKNLFEIGPSHNQMKLQKLNRIKTLAFILNFFLVSFHRVLFSRIFN